MTLLAAISLAGLPVAGVSLHFVSKAGERATIWGLTSHAWMSVHNMLGLLFVIAIAGHLVYNWRALLRYVRTSVARPRAFPAELAVAASVVLVLVTAVLTHALLLD